MQPSPDSIDQDGARRWIERRARRRMPAFRRMQVTLVDQHDVVRTLSAVLCDATDDGYGLVTEFKLPIGEMLWIEDGQGRTVKGVVRYSRHWKELEWRTGVKLLHREQRRRHREPVHGKAFLTWIDGGGKRRSIPAEVIDISNEGMGLLTEQEPPPGMMAQIQGESLECSVLVRYGRRVEGGYRVGLMTLGKSAPLRKNKLDADDD